MALSKITPDNNDTFHGVVQAEGRKRTAMTVNQNNMKVVVNLLTDLYQNPLLATVREVVSNAVDAYDAGVVPTIRVTLPTEFNPAFTVEDHGVGMSPETVETIYSQYSNSTKESDLTKVGAFGLGAKAPLAYCDSFELETTQDGVTTVAEIVRENGELALYHSSSRTNKPNGTTVSVPINVEDINKVEAYFRTYIDNPFDAVLYVNGDRVENNNWVVFMENFVLDSDTGTTGRIWLKKEVLRDPYTLGRIFQSVTHMTGLFFYVLSGFRYGYTTSRAHYSPHENFCVELKPGVVRFSSSRDSILPDSSTADLERRIRSELTVNSQEKYDNVVSNLEPLSPSAIGTIFFRSGFLTHYTAVRGKNYSGIQVNKLPILVNNWTNGVNRVINYTELLSEIHTPNVFFSVFAEGNTIESLDSGGIRGANQVYKHGLTEIMSKSPKVSIKDRLVTLRGNRPVVVVTGVNEEKFKELKPFFTALIRENKSNSFYFSPESNLSDKLLAISLPDLCYVRHITIDKLIEKGREIHAVKSRTAVDNGVITVTEFTERLTPIQLYHSRGASLNEFKISLSEISEQECLLVFKGYRNNVTQTLMGAANSGVDVFNRRVLVVDELNAAGHDLLAEYPHKVYAESFVHRSSRIRKSAVKFMCAPSSNLTHINESPSVQDFAETVNVYISDNFIKLYEKWLRKNAENYSLESIAEIFQEAKSIAMDKTTSAERTGIPLSDSFLKDLGTKEAKVVLLLMSISRANSRYSNVVGLDNAKSRMFSLYMEVGNDSKSLSNMDEAILSELSEFVSSQVGK